MSSLSVALSQLIDHQGGDEASSILDWERRMIAIAAAKYPDGLRVRYINPHGTKATDEPPAWYCAKPTDAERTAEHPAMWWGRQAPLAERSDSWL